MPSSYLDAQRPFRAAIMPISSLTFSLDVVKNISSGELKPIQIIGGRIVANSTPEWAFEMGRLYYEKTDFHLAISALREAAEVYCSQSHFDSYLKCLNLLLRVYIEQEDIEKINETEECLQDIVLKQSTDLSPKAYDTLALCVTYKGQNKVALEYFEKSLSLALSQDRKEDICHAITGLALVYTETDRLEEALREISNLRVFFQVLDLPDIKLTGELIHGHVLCKMGKIEQALEIFWKCHEDLKVQKSLYTYVQLLYAVGKAYSELGDQSRARLYLSLAQKVIDPKNLVRLNRLVGNALASLGGSSEDKFDLVFEESLSLLTEKRKGQVDFKNQFILMDMLKTIFKQPRRSLLKGRPCL